ncbi:hypothetical protein PV326_008316 [Microctonus aethiopoides]|uniref:F-box/LRR-repeat protein 21 n=1 Tax=Microctonus aethiopoides TaxID=144406 RepID=A0AA39FWM2_9HYME|nr:hypothetical protein PV326_008316 [Microctonus aethiopoides]KAK0176569.1 hypothetical protein PV328_000688 [Microctonus aethiopoides]
MLTLPSTSLSTSGLFSHVDEINNAWTIPPDKSLFQSLTIDDVPSNIHLWSDKTYQDVKNFKKLRIDDNSGLSLNDIVPVISRCQCLRELSLSYSLLSDNLLSAISRDDHVCLETMKIDAYSDSMPFERISDEAWYALQSHSPDLNLILTSHLTEEDDHDALLTTSIPITHLYLGGFPSAKMVQRISENCPRLVELIVSSYSPDMIDPVLISIAHKCPNLSAVGLGDCELTCSGLVEFVSICKERLRALYIWETSLVEDAKFDVTQTISKVSSLLGRTWAPEYVPPW